MFASLFKRAQATVDIAIGQAINRVIVAIPFLIALGFATAALYLRFERTYGAESATIILSAIFMAAGLIAVMLSGGAETLQSASTAESPQEELADPATPETSKADRELAMAALTSAAPIALPALVRALMRNLPLVAVILAALVVFLSNPKTDDEEPASASSA
jgi:hypothetical protein